MKRSKKKQQTKYIFRIKIKHFEVGLRIKKRDETGLMIIKSRDNINSEMC